MSLFCCHCIILQSASCQEPNKHHVTLQYLSSPTCFITRVIHSCDGSETKFDTFRWYCTLSNTHCLQASKMAVKKLQIPSSQRTAAVFILNLCQLQSNNDTFSWGRKSIKTQLKLIHVSIVHPCSIILTKYGRNHITHQNHITAKM